MHSTRDAPRRWPPARRRSRSSHAFPRRRTWRPRRRSTTRVAVETMTDDERRYWNREAASFDDEPDHGLRDPSVRHAWRELLLRLLPPAPADVLDVGCGTGSLTVLLADAGYRAQGLDISDGMITAAEAKADAAGVDVEFRVGEAADPPYPRACVDVVLARHVLWALP